MDTRDAFLVDAFTDDPTAGNPAGVVPDADGLADDQMQAVANELGASETAFVTGSDDADRRLRFFTPETEVDRCGHASVAAHALLFERGVIDAGDHSVETAAAVFDASVEDDGTVWLTQDDPAVSDADVDVGTVASALGTHAETVENVGLPVGRASTGLPYLVVPVEYFADLSALDPDMEAVESLTDAHDVTGVYAFTFDTLEGESTLHGRMFAPSVGIEEDPVTGTASGAAGGYLDHHAAVEDTSAMVFEQGHFLDRPGYVTVHVGARVRIAGRAVTTLEGSVVVPESDDEEIVEA